MSRREHLKKGPIDPDEYERANEILEPLVRGVADLWRNQVMEDPGCNVMVSLTVSARHEDSDFPLTVSVHYPDKPPVIRALLEYVLSQYDEVEEEAG